jgi:hypothetical protein
MSAEKAIGVDFSQDPQAAIAALKQALPKLPIPDLIPRITQGFIFLGVAGEKSIQAKFLKCLKINYDFNHAIATHREPFKFRKIEIKDYQENGYYPKLNQEITRADNTLIEIIKNPAFLTTPKTLYNQFEYSFPSTASLITNTHFGQVFQVFILYPETKNRTKTFILLYAKPKNILNKFLLLLLKQNFLNAFDLVVEQDTTAVETLYPERVWSKVVGESKRRSPIKEKAI